MAMAIRSGCVPAPGGRPPTLRSSCYNRGMADPIEARMNFIIEQQAQFSADIQLLKERQAENARQIELNTDRIRQLVDVCMSLARHGEETDQRIRALGKEVRELGKETDQRIRALGEDLRALIDTVDKLVRRNGS